MLFCSTENNKDALNTPVNEFKETAKLRSTRSKTAKGTVATILVVFHKVISY